MVPAWLKYSDRYSNRFFVQLNLPETASTPTTIIWTTRTSPARHRMSTLKRRLPLEVKRGTLFLSTISRDTSRSSTPTVTSVSARNTSWFRTNLLSMSTAVNTRNIPTTNPKIDTWTSSHVSSSSLNSVGREERHPFCVNLGYSNNAFPCGLMANVLTTHSFSHPPLLSRWPFTRSIA